MFDENTRIRDTYRNTSTKNEGDHDDKCMHSITNYETDILVYLFFFSFFFFIILRRMGKNKALAHHTFTYFHIPCTSTPHV